jgi:hypothetical protein
MCVQEKEAEDRGEESACQEEKRGGCEEWWSEMRNPLVEIKSFTSMVWWLGTLGLRPRHLSYTLYQFSISVY